MVSLTPGRVPGVATFLPGRHWEHTAVVQCQSWPLWAASWQHKSPPASDQERPTAACRTGMHTSCANKNCRNIAFVCLGVSTSRRLMGARTGARRRCLLLPARAAQVSHVDHFYSRRRSEGVLTTPCGSQGCILGNMGRLVGWICYTRCEHGSSGFF